jgi:uncharacterized surface protein with fasciclin (FAS1) repeats
VDSKTKNIVWKARPQTAFIKAKMNLKLLQNLWMICSLNIQKSLIQQTSLEIIDSLNEIRKQIIHTKINTMKTNFFTIITIVTTFMFSSSVFAQVDGPILNGVDNTSEYKTIELINMDKDLSTFANLLTLSGLNISLALTEPHTLLVPTNEAFPKCL